jgi:hypothetical protein
LDRPAGTAWLFGGGLLLVASQVWLASSAPELTHENASQLLGILPLITVLPVSAALALWLFGRTNRMPADITAISIMVIAGLAMRLAWFGAPAPIEDDFYRYLWDGALVANGFNPYDYSPGAILAGADTGKLDPLLAAIAGEGREVLGQINFPQLRTIYPGTAQAAFGLAYWIEPWSLDALRLVFLAAETATLILSVAILRRLGANPLWAGLYWCNPFVSIMLIGAAHADILIAPFVLAALLLSASKRPILSGVALGLAAGVKLWPLLLVPLLTRCFFKQPAKLIGMLIAFSLATVLLIGPLFWGSLESNSGLKAYASSWANNNAVFAWLKEILSLVIDRADSDAALRIALLAITGAISLSVALKPTSGLKDLCIRALIVSAAVFYCSPAHFPWYAAWFLPLAAILQSWPLLAVSALLPAYYLFFPSWGTSLFPLFIFGAALIHWLPLIWLLKRSVKASHPLFPHRALEAKS